MTWCAVLAGDLCLDVSLSIFRRAGPLQHRLIKVWMRAASALFLAAFTYGALPARVQAQTPSDVNQVRQKYGLKPEGDAQLDSFYAEMKKVLLRHNSDAIPVTPDVGAVVGFVHQRGLEWDLTFRSSLGCRVEDLARTIGRLVALGFETEREKQVSRRQEMQEMADLESGRCKDLRQVSAFFTQVLRVSQAARVELTQIAKDNQARLAAARSLQRDRMIARSQELKAGRAQIENLDDALLMTDARDPTQVIMSPPMNVDRRDYVITAMIESWSGSVIRASYAGRTFMLSIGPRTRYFGRGSDGLRQNGMFRCVARLVDVVPAGRSMVPVFDAEYVEVP